MPSGPRKRQAAKRRSSSGAGLNFSEDKDSSSGSHASDDGSSPRASDEVNSRLSLDTEERPADQTFQTEEWVRVSDFDVGTPTSTTADSKGDYDAAAEESYGEVRGHDKLADWETVSGETARNSSSAEDVGEADQPVADESSGSSQDQGQKLPHVDQARSDSLSDKEDDEDKSISSEDTSTSHASQDKLEDEDRSSSIVVVPSPREQEDDGHDSSFAEVASTEAGEDEESMVEVSSPEEQEEEDQASGVLEVASLEEEEEEKSGSVSSLEEQEDDQSSSVVVEVASSAHDELDEDESTPSSSSSAHVGVHEDDSSLSDSATVEAKEPEDHQLPEVEEPELQVSEAKELATMVDIVAEVPSPEENTQEAKELEPLVDSVAEVPSTEENIQDTKELEPLVDSVAEVPSTEENIQKAKELERAVDSVAEVSSPEVNIQEAKELEPVVDSVADVPSTEENIQEAKKLEPKVDSVAEVSSPEENIQGAKELEPLVDSVAEAPSTEEIMQEAKEVEPEVDSVAEVSSPEENIQGAKELEPLVDAEVSSPGENIREAKEVEPEVDSVAEVSSPEENIQERERVVEESESAEEESHTSIEPTTPDKVEDKSQPKNPYAVIRSISHEDEEQIPSRTSEVFAPEAEMVTETAEVGSSEMQGVDEMIAKEVHDAPVASGIPEPEQHKLEQLLGIAHSKEIADLGRQEEKLLAKEEEELGKGIAEAQPLAEVLAATDDSKPLEGGELQDLQPVAVEDTPLVEDFQGSHDSILQEEAESKGRAPEPCDQGSGVPVEVSISEGEEEQSLDVFSTGDKVLQTSTQGAGEEEKSLATEESSTSADLPLQTEAVSAAEEGEENEEDVKRDEANAEPSLAVDYLQSSQSTDLPSSSGKETLVQLRSLTGSELPTSFAEASKGAEAAGLSGYEPGVGGSGESPDHSHQYASPKKAEEQSRPQEHWDVASELRGCCEPVHWLFGRLFGARAIQN